MSPTGQRAVFEARGDVVTVPAEHGPVMNITRSSGVAERFPSWSPDGKTLAYWSDRSGEYELTVRPADGTGAERQVTKLGPGFRYGAQWSPDNKKIAFADQAMRIRIVDVETGTVTNVDQSPQWLSHGPLQGWRFSWSADSRWLAWQRPRAERGNTAIFLFDTRTNTRRQVTSGYLADTQPVFDPDGKFLYYLSDRVFDPVYGAFDTSWTYANPTRIVAVPLRRDVKSPLAARNDMEAAAAMAGDAKPGADKPGAEKPATDKPADPAAAAAAGKTPAAVEIELDGFESRAIILPPRPGNYTDLFAAAGKVIYRRLPRAGAGQGPSAVVYYDLAERKEQPVLDNADGFDVSADGKKLLVVAAGKFGIIDLKPGQKLEKPLATGDIEVPVDPRAEWKQMFMDAYRFQRDYFYDPTMHGVDWAEMRSHYLALVEQAVTRWDLNFALGEFIGELNASHTYRSGGDLEQGAQRSVGMLGVDWEKANGAWRIKKIVRGGPWDTDARSPLDEPGLDVKEGDYLLAVNGMPVNTTDGSLREFPGARRQDRGADREWGCVNTGRAAGGRQLSRQRSGAAVSRVDRRASQTGGRGDQGPCRIHLRAEHRRGRAERADAAVHGAVGQGRPGHRRALEQRRPDSRSVHRAARSAHARVLGRARRREPAVAAGRASRAEGDADQRLEWIGRRCVPDVLPASRPRSGDWHAHVGRAHRHQRRAAARGWRVRDRADVPHVQPAGPVVCRGPRR